MIDIKLIREHPELVRDTIKKKFQTPKLKILEEAIKKDSEWRKLKTRVDTLRADRNNVSKEIAEAKKAGKSTSSLMKKAKKIPDEIAKIEPKAGKLEDETRNMLMQLPNLMHSSVPIGKDASENKVIEVIGKPTSFNFRPNFAAYCLYPTP